MDEGRRRWWLSEGRWRARGDGMVEMIERVAGRLVLVAKKTLP